jgi:hypothetical protein
MENEQNTDLNEEIIEEGEVEGSDDLESKDEKKKLTPEQIRGIKQRNFTKLAKELGIELPKPESEKKETKKEGFDNADKAYLLASGIKRDEFAIVQEAIDNTGKSLDDILESKWFQAELKEKRETDATKAAIPAGTKRVVGQARDSVEYWIAKNELPKDNEELARKVVNARIKAETQKSKFSPRGVH